MASAGFQVVGFVVGLVGWFMACVAMAIPQWKIRNLGGSTILTVEEGWVGIWMSCINDSGGLLSCDVYDSLLALPSDLQAARALMCLAVALGIFAAVVSCGGLKCTKFARAEERLKASLTVTGGILFIVAGICVLIPVSWTAANIVADFYNPLVPTSMKTDLGDALFLGWGSAFVLVLGGSILCCSCPAASEHSEGYVRNCTHYQLTAPANRINI
ncbi:claudin-6-like [Chiloscyllium plagiosum]|uniref:claudin-6-like n=1 Tax=Chiloscyllium plagiosum TaxID=36176 RepID=UPI001CB87CDB|nr:claudin-6-like [Chiloscyllium plagiosum]